MNNIREAMQAKGLTQQQVAEHLGVSRQAVQRWCQGFPPSTDRLNALATFLGVTVGYLTGSEKQLMSNSSQTWRRHFLATNTFVSTCLMYPGPVLERSKLLEKKTQKLSAAWIFQTIPATTVRSHITLKA